MAEAGTQLRQDSLAHHPYTWPLHRNRMLFSLIPSASLCTPDCIATFRCSKLHSISTKGPALIHCRAAGLETIALHRPYLVGVASHARLRAHTHARELLGHHCRDFIFEDLTSRDATLSFRTKQRNNRTSANQAGHQVFGNRDPQSRNKPDSGSSAMPISADSIGRVARTGNSVAGQIEPRSRRSQIATWSEPKNALRR
jgi:hypothetical protein